MAEITLTRGVMEEMAAHAAALYPEEACGLLAGRAGRATRFYPVENVHHSPVAYEMEPVQQIRAMLDIEATRLELLAIYHSHPHGPAHPSPTDVALAFYPDQVQLILSLADRERPALAAFTIREGQVTRVEWVVE
jgi:proteasome lid subunit RPN8/RPN11